MAGPSLPDTASVCLRNLEGLLAHERDRHGQLEYLVELIYTPVIQHPIHGSSPFPAAACGATSPTESQAATGVAPLLTNTHVWALFANLGGLFQAHAALLIRLEDCVRKLALVQLPAGANGHSAGRSSSSSSSARPSPQRGEEAAAATIATIVESFFTSEEQRDFMAEHECYTTNYAQSAAPRVLELRGLFQRPVVAGEDELRRGLREDHRRFIQHLYKTLGPRGLPTDARLVDCTLPEHDDTHHADGSNNNNSTNILLPPRWLGFSTLALLLATPLSSHRRILHTAKAILYRGGIQPPARAAVLRERYLNDAARIAGEESSWVLEALSQNDVTHIMSMMDRRSKALRTWSAADPSVGSSSAAATVSTSAASAAVSAGGWAESFLDPSAIRTRVLLHYGRVFKCRGKHERLLLCFNDFLCYAEELRSGRLDLRWIAPLQAVAIAADDASGKKNSLLITATAAATNTAPTSIKIVVDSPEQRRQWLHVVRLATRRRLARLSTTTVDVGDGNPPVRMRAALPAPSPGSRYLRQLRDDQRRQAQADHNRGWVSSATWGSHPPVMLDSSTTATPIGGSAIPSLTHRSAAADVSDGHHSSHNHRRGETDGGTWTSHVVHSRMRSRDLGRLSATRLSEEAVSPGSFSYPVGSPLRHPVSERFERTISSQQGLLELESPNHPSREKDAATPTSAVAAAAHASATSHLLVENVDVPPVVADEEARLVASPTLPCPASSPVVRGNGEVRSHSSSSHRSSADDDGGLEDDDTHHHHEEEEMDGAASPSVAQLQTLRSDDEDEEEEAGPPSPRSSCSLAASEQFPTSILAAFHTGRRASRQREPRRLEIPQGLLHSEELHGLHQPLDGEGGVVAGIEDDEAPRVMTTEEGPPASPLSGTGTEADFLRERHVDPCGDGREEEEEENGTG